MKNEAAYIMLSFILAFQPLSTPVYRTNHNSDWHVHRTLFGFSGLYVFVLFAFVLLSTETHLTL